jgi:hypothetical protein
MGSDNHRSESILWKMHCDIRTIEGYTLANATSNHSALAVDYRTTVAVPEGLR